MEVVLVAAVAFISGLLLREFLPGSMLEGKDLATKEDGASAPPVGETRAA